MGIYIGEGLAIGRLTESGQTPQHQHLLGGEHGFTCAYISTIIQILIRLFGFRVEALTETQHSLVFYCNHHYTTHSSNSA